MISIAPRASARQLTNWCQRLGTMLQSGMDIRQSLTMLAEHQRGVAGNMLRELRDGASQGESITDSLRRCGEYFPPLFRQMVSIGESTGGLAEVLLRMSTYYQQIVQLRGTYLAGILWPAIQFGLALIVVGILIWIAGPLSQLAGEPIDFLGFGAVGTRGLFFYLGLLATIAGSIVTIWFVATRQRNLASLLAGLAIRLPVIGNVMRTMAVARISWALALTGNTSMSAREMMSVALASTGNPYYTSHRRQVDDLIRQGSDMHEALAETQLFPGDFLGHLRAAEQAGQVPETMERLSKQYERQAQDAWGSLTVFAGVITWVLVAAVIIAIIVRLASFYAGIILNLTQGL